MALSRASPRLAVSPRPGRPSVGMADDIRFCPCGMVRPATHPPRRGPSAPARITAPGGSPAGLAQVGGGRRDTLRGADAAGLAVGHLADGRGDEVRRA